MFHTNINVDELNELKPISNPILNGPSIKSESHFIAKDILKKAPILTSFNSIYINSELGSKLVTRGKYITATYSIDNRIRLKSFYDYVTNDISFNRINFENIHKSIKETEGAINIIAGASSLSTYFNDLTELRTNLFKKKHKVGFINLAVDDAVFESLSGNVTSYKVSDYGEVLIYPFLHLCKKKTINITFSIESKSSWDCIKIEAEHDRNIDNIILNIGEQIPIIVDLLRNQEIIDCVLPYDEIKYYYKNPVVLNNEICYFGIGEAHTRSNPIVGQGYNNGIKNVNKIIELIHKYQYRNVSAISNEYELYANNGMKELYHINKMMTQGNENIKLSELYELASKNSSALHFLATTFDDPSLYFPWLINEHETQLLINKFHNYG